MTPRESSELLAQRWPRSEAIFKDKKGMVERKLGYMCFISACAPGESEVTPLPAFLGRVIATFSCSGEKEVNLAVEDAKAAFKIWRQKSGLERGRILLEAARIIRVCFPFSPSGRAGCPSEGAAGWCAADFGSLSGYD